MHPFYKWPSRCISCPSSSRSARLKHDRIELALEFVANNQEWAGPADAFNMRFDKENILTLLFKRPFRNATLNAPPNHSMLVQQLYRRYRALEAVKLAANLDLFNTLLTHKNRNGLKALDLFNNHMAEGGPLAWRGVRLGVQPTKARGRVP